MITGTNPSFTVFTSAVNALWSAVSAASDGPVEEKMRYGIAAVMLGGRYALHYAGWKKHIGLYPVPSLREPLESEIAPFRAEKDSVVFPHTEAMPYELVGRVAREIADERMRRSRSA